ncbi:MAG: hypothetical protein JO131_02700, partial [Gammaproteobacteria bacterium]|nr:hypothetical protein [Gammaproteobacteria bacterium]
MFSKNKNSLEKKSRNDVISEVTTLPPELSELITFFESPDISDLFNLFMQLGKDNRVFFEKKHDIWAKIDSIKEDYSTNRITLNHQTFTDPKETKKYNELIDQYNPISKVYHKMLELWTFMAKTLYQLEPNNPILGWIPTSSDENIRRTKPLDLDDIIGFKEKLIELRDYIETYIKEIPNMTVKYTSFLFFSETANSKNVAGHFLILLDEKLNFLKYAFDAFDVLGMPQLREAKTSDTIKKQNRDAKNSTQGTPEVKSLDEDSEDSKRSSLQISHSQQSSEQPDSKLSAGLYQ